MLRVLHRAGLPRPIGCYRVELSGGDVYELDFAYVSRRLGLELDGPEFTREVEWRLIAPLFHF